MERAFSRLSQSVSSLGCLNSLTDSYLVPLSALLSPFPRPIHWPRHLQRFHSVFRMSTRMHSRNHYVVSSPQHLRILSNSLLLFRLSTRCSLSQECPCLMNSRSVFRQLLKCHSSREDFSIVSRPFTLIKSISQYEIE